MRNVRKQPGVWSVSANNTALHFSVLVNEFSKIEWVNLFYFYAAFRILH